jgi:hypothetical protein
MIDQPGKLYLGRVFDPETQQPTEAPFLLSARDLTTHAVCLGMTGTGKTGTGVCLLEEILLQNIPAIIIDPKGDITNLALTFPNLAPEDFKPWLDADDAARQNVTIDTLAEQTAQQWRDGLAAWGIDETRIRQLRDRAAFQIFTPGSDAGIAVDVLQGLNPPDITSGLTWSSHAEILRERIAQICSAILGLAGIESDPLKGREHILLATIFEFTWRAGQHIDIGMLIRMIQDPPVTRIGMFDMNVFYPKAERFELALALNNLVASPSFSAWQGGQPLDIAALLKPLRDGGSNPAGKTRANIFYLAHLNDSERQFFVMLLVSQLVMWMRSQTGTSVLRCLVYFDEVFGYCPPFPRNPPTKTPIMTLIKQGRAAGLGMFLATQNPADLDYKGLANIGTWLIGRLRTDRDRSRALEGLESAGVGFDRDEYEKPLATLPPRVFLAQSASGTTTFFQTRRAMSFLRGPISRDQIRGLRGDSREKSIDAEGGDSSWVDDPQLPVTSGSIANSQSSIVNPQSSVQNLRPPLPPDVREVFLPATVAQGDREVTYQPYLLASARLRIADRARGILNEERLTYLVALNHASALPDFEHAQVVLEFDPNQLKQEPIPGSNFAPLPLGLSARWMKQAEKLLVEHIYHHGTAQVWFNPSLKVYSRLDESQREFRERCEDAARVKRDAEAQKVRGQFERRMALLQDRLAREQRELSMDRAELDARKRGELLTKAESIFNFVAGRSKRGTGRSGSSGAIKRRQAQQAEEEVRESEDAIAKLNADLQQISAEYRATLDAINTKWMNALDDVQQVAIAPKKSNIFADVVILAWAPE